MQGEKLRWEHQTPSGQHLTKQLVLGNRALTSSTTGSSLTNEGSMGDVGSAWLYRATGLLTQ